MTTEIQRTAYLPLELDGMTFEQEIECDITIRVEDDGCGELSWSIIQIDRDNQTGTGWIRFRPVYEPTTLRDRLGSVLIAAAYKDPLLEQEVIEAWREIKLEEAA